MGKIETDNTGSGGGITLSSDGTSLLLDGTAIGGGGGGATNINGLSDGYSVGNSVGLGSNALGNDDGSNNYNTAVGVDALKTVTSGRQNTAVGSGALESVSTGTFNSAVGRLSLFGVTGGSLNVSVGYISGLNITTGNHNTFIGYQAKATTNVSDSVGLGYGSRTAGNGSISVGTSYSSGTSGFAAAITNNSSSYGALANNTIAMGSLAKAYDGAGSIAIGTNNIARSGGSIIGGSSNQVQQNHGTIVGGHGNLVSNGADYGRAGGLHAWSNGFGKDAWSSGRFAATGDSQTGTTVFRAVTTNATPVEMTGLSGNGGSAQYYNTLFVPNNSAYAFTVMVVAREKASEGTEAAALKFEGLIRREADAASTVLVGSNMTTLSNANSFAAAVTANTTNGTLAITVTGKASTNIRWTATATTTEVTYA